MQVGNTYLIGMHQARAPGADAVLEAFLAPDGGTFGAPFAAHDQRAPGRRRRTGPGSARRTARAIDVTIDDVLVASGAMPTLASTVAIVSHGGSSSYASARDGRPGWRATPVLACRRTSRA
jgi:hypothetical protein